MLTILIIITYVTDVTSEKLNHYLSTCENYNICIHSYFLLHWGVGVWRHHSICYGLISNPFFNTRTPSRTSDRTLSRTSSRTKSNPKSILNRTGSRNQNRTQSRAPNRTINRTQNQTPYQTSNRTASRTQSWNSNRPQDAGSLKPIGQEDFLIGS